MKYIIEYTCEKDHGDSGWFNETQYQEIESLDQLIETFINLAKEETEFEVSNIYQVSENSEKLVKLINKYKKIGSLRNEISNINFNIRTNIKYSLQSREDEFKKTAHLLNEIGKNELLERIDKIKQGIAIDEKQISDLEIEINELIKQASLDEELLELIKE